MRSMLFVPADSEKKIGKSLGVGADALILDLEDSVAASNKPQARAMAAAFIKETRPKAQRPRLYVRINPLDGAFWEDDVTGVIGAQPDGIILPKPNSAADADRLALVLDHAEKSKGIAQGQTRIIAIATETPTAMLTLPTYLGATQRLEGITWGAEDLSAVIGSSATRETDGRTWTSPYRLARDLCLMTAVAAGRQPIDTVYVNFRDQAGHAEECRIAARDGFTGKMAIHPDLVPAINAAFTPAAEEIAWAKEIEAMFAANPNSGALNLRGQMIDRPHQVRAARVLARARMAGLV
ncbi:MAG TPA: CoA ester lyase [Hyphomicrobiaceae bacterium]|nr:CoA ester lyase [Hyphomicrobiaceae bacterium]